MHDTYVDSDKLLRTMHEIDVSKLACTTCMQHVIKSSTTTIHYTSQAFTIKHDKLPQHDLSTCRSNI